MATGIPTNRTNAELPVELSQEIIKKTQEGSKVMQLARQIALPGRGAQIPVIVGDPTPEWVSETGRKPVSNPNISKKIMQAQKLAVLVPFSMEFRRDAAALYDALIERLPGALARKFDQTVFFGPTSGSLSNFDNLSNVTAVSLQSSVYGGLVTADTNVSEEGGVINGYVFSPQGRGMLLGALDGDNRPLFLNNISESAVPRILGAPTHFTSAAYKAGTNGTSGSPDIVGFAGDWSHAMYGIVEGVKIEYSSEASFEYTDALGQTQTVHCFQDNMFAVRAEVEIGFICEADYFNALVRNHAA